MLVSRGRSGGKEALQDIRLDLWSGRDVQFIESPSSTGNG